MFYDPLQAIIHDFVRGQEDIRKGIIRTIGDPHERFFEDRLRMLRAFRFATRFNFTIDTATQQAIRENAGKLFPAVAIERVWQEFNKMAAYPHFGRAVVEMHRLTLLEVIFPEIACIHTKELHQRVKNFLYFPSNCPTILYIMEILTSLSFKEKLEIAKRLKVSNKDCQLLEFIELLDQAVIKEQVMCKVDLHEWATLLSHRQWQVCMQVLAARYAGFEHKEFFRKYQERYQELEKHIQRIKMAKPLVTADLLQQHGIKPGKRMGQLLKEAERVAIQENCEDSPSILAKLSQHPLWKEES